MNTVTIDKKKFNIPENWDEITEAHLLLLGKQFPLIPTGEVLFKIFYGFLKINKPIATELLFIRSMEIAKKVTPKGKPNIFLESVGRALGMLDNFNWIFTTNCINKCIIQEIKVYRKIFYGPGENLYNVTINEFKHADKFFMTYMMNKEIKWLNLLLATLWRQAGEGIRQDKRMYFHEEDIQANADILAPIPLHIKHAALLNYIGLRNAVINSPNGRKVFSKSATKATENSGWGEVILKLAGNKFGDFEKTKSTMLYDVLSEIVLLKETKPAKV